MGKNVLKKRHRIQLLVTKLYAAIVNINAFNDFVFDRRYKIHPIDFVHICASTEDLEVAKAAFEQIEKSLDTTLNRARTMKFIVKKSKLEEIVKMAAEKIEVVV